MTPKYEVGCRVVVLPRSEYQSKYKDEVGEVQQTFTRHNHIMYGVKLDNYSNASSGKGLFWFDVTSINFENKYESEEIKMFNNFVVAEVEFLDNPKTGVYKTGAYSYALYDSEIKEGDSVVVNTGHHGFALAKIVALSTNEEDKKKVQCGREIVCRVDFSKFFARKEAVKKAVELKRSMEQRIREAQELALYEALAEKDPTLKSMLDEYRTLMEACK